MIDNDDDGFVEFFIDECMKKDISSLKGICKEASTRIDEIRKEIEDQNKLRAEMRNLEKVLHHFGQDERKKKKKKRVINTNTPITDVDPSYFDLMVSICNFVETTTDKVTPREIMNKVGSLENNSEVYMAIKWLCDNGILTRNDDRSLVFGENWKDRPTFKEAVNA